MKESPFGGYVINQTQLSFHLCSIMIYSVIFVNTIKNKHIVDKLKSFMVPCLFIGAAMALLIPTEGVDFTVPRVWQFMLIHGVLVFYGIYLAAVEKVDLSLKAYFAGDRDAAVTQMEKSLEAMEKVYETFHRAESAKWQIWYKNECLACYAHTHDLIECALSLLRGEGEILVRPFVDFGGHNKHVSLYQHKRGNGNFPYLYPHS
jgi:hypothetical protein